MNSKSNKNITYTFKLGYVLSIATRIFAVFILITSSIGFVYSLTNVNVTVFLSIITFIISTLMISYKNGVDISTSSGSIRKYHSLIGLKSGKWENYSKYTDLVILTIRLKAKIETNTGGISNIISPINLNLDYQNKQTAVYLMTPTHRQRILMKICKTEAEQVIKSLKTNLNKKISVFNPQISANSKEIKRR